ncbi:MAG: rRNA adenine dimethyltransferase family protein, partial [Acidobacteriota bacterium]
AVLQRLIEQGPVFSNCVLMFQREVVDRITAEPGNSDRGFLTVITEAYMHTERLFDVPPAAFRPAPKVWSSVVSMRSCPGPDNFERFRRLVSTAFLQKRKTLFNNLRSEFPDARELIVSAGIDPTRRAESLSLDDWKRLDASLAEKEITE